MGEWTDLAILLLGKLGRWFNIQGQRACFLIWMVCLVYWTARNARMGLVSQTGGCVVSLAFHIYGFYNWKHKGIGT